MWPDGVSNSGFRFLIGYVISVRDTKEFVETSHLQCLYPSFNVVIMVQVSHAYKNMDTAIILSKKMLKRVGESRHPWRTPVVVRNHSPMLLSW